MELSLGELMVRAGVVTGEERDRAVAAQGRTGANLVAALVQDGVVDEGRVMTFVAERFGLEETDLGPSDVDEAALDLLPPSLLRKRRLLPFALHGLGAGRGHERPHGPGGHRRDPVHDRA